MKSLLLLNLLHILGSVCQADTNVAAPSGDYFIKQSYHDVWHETLTFKDATPSTISLKEYPWPGIYNISPKETWLLRIQKIGSGENIALLYKLDKSNHRVTEIKNFNNLLWAASDKVSTLKQKDLYHTGVDEAEWSKDNETMTLTLKGSSDHQVGVGFQAFCTYNLRTSTISVSR